MKNRILKVLNNLGVGITSASNLENLKAQQSELLYLQEFIQFQELLGETAISSDLAKRAILEFPKSRAQLHQDLIALILSGFKQEGYFVEFGATDGERFSNSHLLEKSFNWKGILAEPGRSWHNSLHKNRTAIIETKCVWKSSGDRLEFNETEVGELSTLEMFSDGDSHANQRVSGKRYFVETISLEDMLDKNNAPKFIDYLSVDTEGSEFQILRNFNFEKYTFGFISCEHNYTESRKKVADLLAGHGYRQILENMSLFDDWFVHNSLIKTKGLI